MGKPSALLLAEGFYTFKKTNPSNKCWVAGCTDDAKVPGSMCSRHTMRRWRAKSKRTADYCTLRDHAKARGLEFRITLDYWAGLTDAFGFYRSDNTYVTIDRVDATKGYVEGNLRVVSLSANAAKSNRERYLPEHVRSMLERKRSVSQRQLSRFAEADTDDDDQSRLNLDESTAEYDKTNYPF